MTDSPATTPSTKAALRRKWRAARRALPPKQQQRHAEQLLQQFLRTHLPLRFHRFALYVPADGEIDTWPLIEKLLSFNRQIGLPCLRRNPTGRLGMHLAPYSTTTPLLRGHYHLLEPECSARVRTGFVADVLLMPLVGFDTQGHRLGMGGGFYDRYASPLERVKPALRIGLAHHLQGLPAGKELPTDRWDVSLDGLITEQNVLSFNNRARQYLLPSTQQASE